MPWVYLRFMIVVFSDDTHFFPHNLETLYVYPNTIWGDKTKSAAID